jgi:hypothetical protein
MIVIPMSRAVMLLRFAYLPIFFWLLLPPGICLCKYSRLYPFLLSRFTGLQTVLPGEPDTGREEDDRDHAPWCPRNKMIYAHLSPGTLQLASASIPLMLDPTDLAPARVESAIASETTVLPGDKRSMSDRYLILRALRI